MIHYLKTRIWDFFLCIAISVGLVMHIYSGFILEDKLSSNIGWVTICMMVLLIIFFIFAYNRITTISGIVIGIVGFIGFLIYARSNHIFADEASNSLSIAVAITILTALTVFLSTRTSIGIIILLVIGNFVTAGSYFLQYPVKAWSFYLFLFSTLLILWYRNYSMTLLKIQTGKVRIKTYFVQSMIMCLVAIFLASGAYIGLIKPLNPPTRALKLITKLENMDILQVMGVTTPKEMLDPNFKSNRKPSQENENTNSDKKETIPNNTKSKKEKKPQSGRAVHYNLHSKTIPWLIIILISLIIVLIGLKIFMRKHWEGKVRSLSNENQVVNYYQLFLRKLALAGYGRPSQNTLLEYAKNLEFKNFSYLTEVYSGVFYGRQKVSEEQKKAFVDFYQSFYKDLRKEMGTFQYVVKVVFHLGRRRKKD